MVDTPYLLLDLVSGEVEQLLANSPDEPLDVLPIRATYSPDGEWLVFSGAGTRVTSGLFLRPSSESGPGQDLELVDNSDGKYRFTSVSWRSSGTIFAQTSPQSGLILDVSGGNEPPETSLVQASAKPEASPVIAGPVDPAVVAVGTELVTNDAVTLQSAPGPNAPVVAELPSGTSLLALGLVEDGAGFSWNPVRSPESGTSGYVRAELVSPG